jgi:hyperosmotically inducible protein
MRSLRRCLFGAVLAAALVVLPSQARAGDPPDAWVTTKVKLALLTAPDVTPTRIHVDTVNGTVILHGKVRNVAEKAAAEKIARSFHGTRGVRDLLQVVPVKSEAVIANEDNEIRDSVKVVLSHNSALADSDISVKSVDRGVVLLEGTADSLTDYLFAVEEVSGVPGVRRVSTEVKSTELLAEPKTAHLEIGRVRISRVGRPAPPSGVTPVARTEPPPAPEPSRVQDTWASIATRMRLLADKDVPALDVGVEVRHGSATLFGIVPDQRAKDAATRDALAVDSVTYVSNELQVVPQKIQKAVQVGDRALSSSIRTELARMPELASVTVSVNNAVVHLSGSVPSVWERVHAATVARAVSGVRSVDDDLQVERPRASR